MVVCDFTRSVVGQFVVVRDFTWSVLGEGLTSVA
jgi:hypothetical protein